METPSNIKPAILHVCSRETIRPLRDQVLRLSGFDVDSTLSHSDGLSLFWSRQYDLVLIDVEGEIGIPQAEKMCSEIKTAQHEQLVAFVFALLAAPFGCVCAPAAGEAGAASEEEPV